MTQVATKQSRASIVFALLLSALIAAVWSARAFAMEITENVAIHWAAPHS